MTNREIYIALIKPNAEIIILPSDLKRKNILCLKANGISAKKNYHNIITVLESNDSRIPIGSVILFINGIYSDYLDTSKITEALLFPRCNIMYEIDIINKCLEANSIYASRKGNSKELIVTHSNKSTISIGTVVLKIDSLLVDQFSNESIIALLQEPNRIMEFNTDIINQCLEANSIYASRKGNSKELIVTHSNKSTISIGTVVLKIDSLLVDQFSNESIIALLQEPNRIIEFALPSDDAINYDAKQYAKQYDSLNLIYAEYVQ